jgi:hypothetical protein
MIQPSYVQPQPMPLRQSPQAQRLEPPPWPPRTNPPQTAQQPVAPITARGMMAETPKVVSPPLIPTPKLNPVSMPSPDEVGVVPPGAKSVAMPSLGAVGMPQPAKAGGSKVDWNETRERLDRLGAIGLQTAKLADGRHRVAFVLRTRQADQVQHVEATAATEAEAVALALDRAEKCVK